MSSFLPDHMEEDTIERMELGDTGYTVPWAMYVERDRSMWINGKYTVSQGPGGTVHMLIKRMSDGVEVDSSTIGDQRFSPGGSSFVGGSNAMPVTLVSGIKFRLNGLFSR